MSEGELKKRLLKVGWLGDEFKGSYMAPKKDVWGVLDEAKKEFYKIINEDVPEADKLRVGEVAEDDAGVVDESE
jgi:hypothetical protein